MKTHRLALACSSSRSSRSLVAPALLAALLAQGCAAYLDELEDPLESEQPLEARVATAPTTACPPSSGIRVWPISGQPTPVPATDVVQDVYGAITRSRADHNHGGIDFRAPTGTPVHAVADGFVTRRCEVGQPGCSGHAGKGNWLLIQHFDAGPGGETLYTAYAHLSSFDVDDRGTELEQGDCVAAGEVVGQVGRTGVSSTEHLHLSLHADLSGARSPVNANSLNPWLVLPDKSTTVGYAATPMGPDADGRLRLRVEAEAQYANMARLEVYRVETRCFPTEVPPYTVCFDVPVNPRIVDWDGAGVMTCGPVCGDIEIEPFDFDPGDYRRSLDPREPAESGDLNHVWDFVIEPASPEDGDEVFYIRDVHGRTVASGDLD